MSNLTPKQYQFIEQYCLDQNATQAAIRAGYSAKTAQVQGSRLLSNVMVLRALNGRFQEHRNRCNVSINSLTEQLEKLRVIAIENLNLSAGVSAIMATAKLHGLLVTKIKQNVNIGLAGKLMEARKRVGFQ
jgi:phage terminase small subunit